MMRKKNRIVQPREQVQSCLGDEAENLAAIVKATFPSRQLFGLQTIDQPRDPRGLFDHPLGYLERRKAVLSRAAQNAEDVVLLHGDSERLDDRSARPPDDVGGTHEGHCGFLHIAAERFVLFELAKDAASRIRHVINIPGND